MNLEDVAVYFADEERDSALPRFVEDPGEDTLREFSEGDRVQLRKRSKQPTYVYVRYVSEDDTSVVDAHSHASSAEAEQ